MMAPFRHTSPPISNATRPAQNPGRPQEWLQEVSKYTRPDLRRAVWQLVDTFIPYICVWALIVLAVQQQYPVFVTLPLLLLAASLLIRIFIIFHDCTHGSFFPSRRANRILGFLAGVLTFTPFAQWQRSHSRHHDTVGDLDRRGTGDVWTMTVEEYQAAPRLKRIGYRLTRNPFLMLGIGPIALFLVGYRFFSKADRRRERTSVVLTDVALVIVIALAAFTIGVKTYFLIQLPITLIAGAMGIGLFYVQHQYENVYWARHQAWQPLVAALAGSSYFKLPPVLQWFTGSIGLHHVHHVQQRIPNYNLQECLDSIPALQTVKPLTMRDSIRCLRMNLWDEKQQRLVSFRSLKPPETRVRSRE